MNMDKPTRASRVEAVIRGMLGLLLLVAVLWALANDNGATQGFDLVVLPAR